MGLVKARPDLHRHRLPDPLCHGPDHLACQLRIRHEARALIVVHDLRNGTPHVEIDAGPGSLLQKRSDLAADLRVRPEELQGQRPVLRHRAQQLRGAPVTEGKGPVFAHLLKRGPERPVVPDCLRADHFRHRHLTSLFPAEKAEGQVRDAGHWSEKDPVLQGDVSDPHSFFSSASSSVSPRKRTR